MPIKRYFEDESFHRIKRDFGFLFEILKSFYGQIYLAFREKYFNLYFQGNSIAKVELKENNHYKITIHRKFCPRSLNDDERFSSDLGKDYKIFKIQPDLLWPFFQKKNLEGILSKIKDENYSEELTFEQMLITDNLDRQDIMIIDRQITDTKLNRKRIDILALKQVRENNYHFVVMEVKMGNNPDLKGKVGEQISFYMKHLCDNFPEYKLCYEKQYEQKKMLGLISAQWPQIKIGEGISGLIVVGGYSGLAKEQIIELKNMYPNLIVWQSPKVLLPRV